ncbi:hypothetical protein SASPL_143268 [Salvia splendens]|uniref:Uncharacterized protein n=1 Tax=Salvia splendens TaxID=180675 RepID=A0A8X8WNB5_SALSN|nr:hypothetical protein SASPL_143268 [Salvia splendens]
MDSSLNQQQAVCGKESIDLLNCVAQSPFDQEKCLSLLQTLRQCVINKSKGRELFEHKACSRELLQIHTHAQNLFDKMHAQNLFDKMSPENNKEMRRQNLGFIISN